MRSFVFFSLIVLLFAQVIAASTTTPTTSPSAAEATIFYGQEDLNAAASAQNTQIVGASVSSYMCISSKEQTHRF